MTYSQAYEIYNKWTAYQNVDNFIECSYLKQNK